jgi:hypothetical protein
MLFIRAISTKSSLRNISIMAHKKHGKAITPFLTDPVGVVRSISAGRPTDIENQIHQRAYELYSARGRAPGRDLEDWFCAEKEVMRA